MLRRIEIDRRFRINLKASQAGVGGIVMRRKRSGQSTQKSTQPVIGTVNATIATSVGRICLLSLNILSCIGRYPEMSRLSRADF